jgi:rod shape-determining protein MreC
LANDRNSAEFVRPIRRLLVGLLAAVLFGLFLFWRIDSPRIERLRAQMVDAVVPNFDWALAPFTRISDMFDGFQSYASLYEQNQELRRELQQMRAWREAALQLEQKNAQLLDLNNVRLDPELTFVTGVVMADVGSPFRQSVLLNIGARDGILDGWAAMDGLGLAGRISGVGQTTSRVILLTDSNSRIPVTVLPSGQRAILAGDNSLAPPLEFLEHSDLVRPGDRVVSSGDGGMFPTDLLVGQVALGTDGRLRVRLAADYERLDFLRILRSRPAEWIEDPGTLVSPPEPFGAPEDPADVSAENAEAGDG